MFSYKRRRQAGVQLKREVSPLAIEGILIKRSSLLRQLNPKDIASASSSTPHPLHLVGKRLQVIKEASRMNE